MQTTASDKHIFNIFLKSKPLVKQRKTFKEYFSKTTFFFKNTQKPLPLTPSAFKHLFVICFEFLHVVPTFNLAIILYWSSDMIQEYVFSDLPNKAGICHAVGTNTKAEGKIIASLLYLWKI